MIRRFRRRAGVTERVVGSAVFLADGGAGSLYRLNDTGSALWRLLARPVSVEEATTLFRAAFPDRKAAKIREDVVGLLDALLEEALIEEVPAIRKRGGGSQASVDRKEGSRP